MFSIGNVEFLQESFGKAAGHLWVCSFAKSPNDAPPWGGEIYRLGAPLVLPETHNNYFSIAELSQPRRLKENFIRMAILVLDDAEPSALPIKPSYVIETSPGKCQVGFILNDTPEARDPEYCTRALQNLIKRGLVSADKSGNNIVRYVRLPVGSNTKPRDTGSFRHVLHIWEPSQKYNLPAALVALGISITVGASPDAAEDMFADKEKLDIREAFEDILTGTSFHDGLIRLAAHFVVKGILREDIQAMLFAYMDCSSVKASDPDRWKARRDEIPRAIESAFAKFGGEFSNSSTTADVHPQPVNLFGKTLGTPPKWEPDDYPEIIARLAKDISHRMGVDPVIPAFSAIAVAAALIHDRHCLQVKAFDTKWLEAARLWIALVGDPSTKKSPAMREVFAPIKKLQAGWHEQYRTALLDWKKQAIQAKHNKSPEPDPPQPRKVIVNDITLEALCDALETNHGGILAEFDELSGFFGSMDAYRQNGVSKDRAAWLTAYNGGSLFVDRVGKGKRYIKNFSVGIIGGIQPDPMRRIASRHGSDDGLLQRFITLSVCPAGRGADVAPDAATQNAWESLCSELSDTNKFLEHIRLSSEAQMIMDAARKKLHILGQNPAFDRRLQTALQKAEGQLARLTLIFHFVENREGDGVFPDVPADAVGTATMKKSAHLFLQYIVPNMISFYHDIIGDGETMALVRLVAGYILAHKMPAVAARDIYRAHNDFRGTEGRRALDEVMQQLELAAWVSPVPTAKGKQATTWHVNPRVYSDFADLAEKERIRRESVKAEIRKAASMSDLSLEDSLGVE
ncbi:MAG: DUF3987 domain-containing protein [Alphaproteobacteria bacterium]|nr:DUF3987 domain-containing protein [Alphaproteobacteria bacterium]